MTTHRTDAPSRRELQSFGLLVGGALGALWLYRHFTYGNRLIPLLLVAVVLIAFGAWHPFSLVYPFRAWMWAGDRIGAVVSRIVLAACYFLILTPIAAIRRLFVRDPLELRWDSEMASYFREKHIQSRQQFERMF